MGFVGATEAKEALRDSGLPALSNVSEKGGSAVAAAAFNALLRVARDQDLEASAARGRRGRPPLKPALLIAGHGTREPAGVTGLRRADRARRPAQTPDRMPVAGGFIELSEPPLRDAVTDLVAHGHRDLVAVPLMLSAAGHSKGDVPAALARETARHPGLSVRYGRPLGPHPVLLNLMAARIDAVTAGLPEPACGAAGRAGHERPGRQRRRGQGGPAAVGGPGV